MQCYEGPAGLGVTRATLAELWALRVPLAVIGTSRATLEMLMRPCGAGNRTCVGLSSQQEP